MKNDQFQEKLDQHAQSLQLAEHGNHGQGGAIDVMHDRVLRQGTAANGPTTAPQ